MTFAIFPPKGILKVVLYKPEGLYEKSRSVEVRFGPTSELSKTTRHSANMICGSTPGNSNVGVEPIFCRNPLDGRYLTAQSLAKVELAISEVAVYVEGKST